jgi:hypothetical protein
LLNGKKSLLFGEVLKVINLFPITGNNKTAISKENLKNQTVLRLFDQQGQKIHVLKGFNPKSMMLGQVENYIYMKNFL